ncbi:Dihydropteroate synthase [Coniophora puteana RWD-64-598 SS2]|uniref:Dihydropteroate synthase n=1 Tax=Coniophora puteana (strain RWD-64-598) TaxID=741705 RepID=A0A5M3MM23_CONPW|nr:Dihydropteroate synthase [Coniophora puteana RWD-64-598 SS2]EIW79725.1 Dihydropteroate synthase [Coniophora puteana RWD-64-598 SS2]
MSTDHSIPSSTLDAIHVKDIRVPVYIRSGSANEQAPAEGTALVTITLFHDVSIAAATDELSYSINYAEIYERVRANCSGKHYANLGELVAQAHAQVADSLVQPTHVKIRAKQTKISEASSFTFELERDSSTTLTAKHTFRLEGITCSTIIGVNESERHTNQPVTFDITVRRRLAESPIDFIDLSVLTRTIKEHARGTSFLTLEALASSVASRALQTLHADDEITVKASKPEALSEAEAPQVEISRRHQDFPAMFPRGPEPTPGFGKMTTLLASVSPISSAKKKLATSGIALGSNIGDRFANIETALRLLERPASLLDDLKLEGEGEAEVAIVNTSFMYETMPMYVTDQPRFANCACVVETNLPPTELLRLLKKIEVTVGRVPSIRNGPRAVDLDVILYNSDIIDTRPSDARRNLDNLEGHLVVPHPRIAERCFVLQPLADMIPDFVHPVLRKPIGTLLRTLESAHPEDVSAMIKVMPFPQYPLAENGSPLNRDLPVIPPTARYWTFGHPSSRTYVMATLNATPDSFSDGSVNNTLDAAMAYATKAIASGADIIDIGGYSTRPDAAFVSDEEEINRVVPIVKAIRAQKDTPDVANALISIDTFRYTVAEAAVLAGVNCINDVYAFGGPDYPLNQASVRHFAQFRRVSRDLGVPVILMHSRGDAGSNKDYSTFSEGVLEGVRRELGDRVDAAVTGRGGIRRWLIMLDPGIGFSKTIEGNLALLRHASSLTSSVEGSTLLGYPQLIGTSKKSFLGKILERKDDDGPYAGRVTEARERGWATAAAVTCAVQQGAAAIRVHDVQEMKDVVVVASAIWS